MTKLHIMVVLLLILLSMSITANVFFYNESKYLKVQPIELK